jgi:hypothetical protein
MPPRGIPEAAFCALNHARHTHVSRRIHAQRAQSMIQYQMQKETGLWIVW